MNDRIQKLIQIWAWRWATELDLTRASAMLEALRQFRYLIVNDELDAGCRLERRLTAMRTQARSGNETTKWRDVLMQAAEELEKAVTS